jgi:predicted enzyme related to lactoylglutathione lyase
MPRVVHFEIHAENPERALRFYSAVFGWQFDKWAGPMDYWLIRTGPDEERGINGGMVRRMGLAPVDDQAVNAYCCTVMVPSVDDFVARATSLGATVALPKMAIPGVGWLAYIKDTEGNILGLMASDPSAR